MARTDVLIAGAGPTGLVLALWLAKFGVSVRIVDKSEGPGETSRALAIHARTLELYRQLDLADAVIARGRRVAAANLWARGEKVARIPFEFVGERLTAYPFLEVFPQDAHERLLIERLEKSGLAVARRTELVQVADADGHIRATLCGPDGREEICEAPFLAGCDGAHSTVRSLMRAGFPGGAYQRVFYVADVAASGPALNGELHVDLDEADFLAVFPMPGEGRARLVGTVRDARAERARTLTFDDVGARAIDHMKVKVETLNWFSTYHVHHRVAARFRFGRVFLLGDAGHIHSPAGGQGMNTGIGDAVNLAWKLAAVVGGFAPEDLLDSYEAERIGFARRLVATTDRVFSFATAEGRLADFLRTRATPLLLPRLMRLAPVRDYIFRNVSQIALNYRGGPLSVGEAGAVAGGDRLPWAPMDGSDNFAPLSELSWQAHVYGAAGPALAAWCADHGLPLHVFDWGPTHVAAGLKRDALYLVRPDGYVALADPAAAPAALERYFAQRGIRLAARQDRRSAAE
ncbi:FAD-dependent monooxygenase [Methylocystis echinoides]|uniref:FAD-dependent monooxygenase n=1 Tax=Methylocystis echinoides TaxID=29468 RepID=UPI003435DBEA